MEEETLKTATLNYIIDQDINIKQFAEKANVNYYVLNRFLGHGRKMTMMNRCKIERIVYGGKYT